MWSSKDVYYISDSTGILATNLGQALICQFPEINFHEEKFPFVLNSEEANKILNYILKKSSGRRPLIFSTIMTKEIRVVFDSPEVEFFDAFEIFMTRLEGCLEAKALGQEAKPGDSIAINGACLTIVEARGTTLAFDISDETLKSTNLGELKVRDRVNLEPALRLSDRLGGHFVTGHIDGAGRIRSKNLEGEAYKIVIETEPRLTEYLVEKGSVAVDGVSLTVVDVMRDGFSLVVIPHTAKLTTLGFKSAGDKVNVEVDILGKYVSKYLKKGKDLNLMQTLKASGFV